MFGGNGGAFDTDCNFNRGLGAFKGNFIAFVGCFMLQQATLFVNLRNPIREQTTNFEILLMTPCNRSHLSFMGIFVKAQSSATPWRVSPFSHPLFVQHERDGNV
jgi:hypothetical protein